MTIHQDVPACLCCNPIAAQGDVSDTERDFMAGAGFVVTLTLKVGAGLCFRHARMFQRVVAGIDAAHAARVERELASGGKEKAS